MSISTQQPRREASKNPELQPVVDNDVLIRGGSFLMGSPRNEHRGCYCNGFPQHQVQVADFYLGRYPVTRGEYARFARNKGSKIRDKLIFFHRGLKDYKKINDHHPMVSVSWEDTQVYIKWLQKETGLLYRLPSEAEWEYACRAGTTTRFWWGNDLEDSELARASANFSYNLITTEVGNFNSNRWGLYDMSGNVWEWVQDCWNPMYENPPTDGLAWLRGDCSQRVLRGGSHESALHELGSAYRNWHPAHDDGCGSIFKGRNSFGFRLARSLD